MRAVGPARLELATLHLGFPNPPVQVIPRATPFLAALIILKSLSSHGYTNGDVVLRLDTVEFAIGTCTGEQESVWGYTI